MDSPPADHAVRVVHKDDIVFVQHRHRDLFDFLFPEWPLIELLLHWLSGCTIGEAAHEEEGVWILQGKKRAEDLHSDLGVCRDRARAEDLQEFSAVAGTRLIGAHFDDHSAEAPEHEMAAFDEGFKTYVGTGWCQRGLASIVDSDESDDSTSG